jgi:CHAD domain-containing protein
MTPGLASFVADRTDPQTWDDTVDAAVAALAAEFTVAPEPSGGKPSGGGPSGGKPSGGGHSATWLDTFDWRLHKAGLTLEYLPGRGGSEVRLSGAAPDANLTQPVTGWQASRPHPLADLANGPVGDRIGGLIAPRALVPVVTTNTVTTGYRLLNSDDKIVARLLVERSTVPAAAGALAPRLTITEVRGYQGQARRAARLVAAVHGLGPVAEPLFADSLRALGRRPGDYSNKVDADITAAMPAAGAAAAILLRLLDTVEVNVPGVLADTDTEFLHDLRVSVRRTRSALKLLGDVLGLPAAELDRYAADFKWVGDLTTPTRDLDVHLLDFDGTASALAAAKPDDLEPFRAYLQQRRHREFRALVRGLRSPRFVTLLQGWRAALVTVRDDNQPGPTGAGRARSGQSTKAAGAVKAVGAHKAGKSALADKAASAGKLARAARAARASRAAREPAGLLAAERTRVTFAKVAKRGALINSDTPAEALHDLRKRCKELRYALEFFAPLHDPAGYAKVVGDLKRLQDCLGDFQDTEVQVGEIRMLAGAMLAAAEAPAVTLLAMGEVTAGLAVRQRAARADFERRFAAFADVEGQRRMSALLRGTGVRDRNNADIRDL